MESFKPYKKSFDYSYTLGAFPTFELIEARPEQVIVVYIHSTFTEKKKLENLCACHKIPVEINDKVIARLSEKENVFVIGVFKKYKCELSENKSHLVLVNPSNLGNIGTILRTALGFGLNNIAFVDSCVDVFHPKVVRASMGALFKLNQEYFVDFATYQNRYPRQKIYTFMLDGEKSLTVGECPKEDLFSLVFGNEATGLDDSYKKVGTSVIIPQSKEVDSLNLTIAVGIGSYLFTQAAKNKSNAILANGD